MNQLTAGWNFRKGQLLVEKVEHGLHARFAHVLEAQKGMKEPKATKDLPAARERASAELGFVTYVERLR